MEMKNKSTMKSSRFLLSLIASMLLSAGVFAQPGWFAGTPAVNGITPYSININYGINMTGTVYVIVYNFNNAATLTSSQVRAAALAGPAGGRVAVAVLTINAGNMSSLLQQLFSGLASNTPHTFFLVAENTAGTLMTSPYKLYGTTLPCPKIQLFNYFGNLGECVNLGAQGMWQVSQLGLLPTGILNGTTWTIDWGTGLRYGTIPPLPIMIYLLFSYIHLPQQQTALM